MRMEVTEDVLQLVSDVRCKQCMWDVTFLHYILFAWIKFKTDRPVCRLMKLSTSTQTTIGWQEWSVGRQWAVKPFFFFSQFCNKRQWTVCQRQCSLLSHWTFFVAAWKLNCSSVLTTDTAPVKRLYCHVTHFHLPAAFCCGRNLEVYRL